MTIMMYGQNTTCRRRQRQIGQFDLKMSSEEKQNTTKERRKEK